MDMFDHILSSRANQMKIRLPNNTVINAQITKFLIDHKQHFKYDIILFDKKYQEIFNRR